MIESYRFGEIIVDGQRYTHHVVISSNGVRRWRTKEGHVLCPDDLADIIKDRPEVVVIGTGKFGLVHVPPAVFDYATSHQVKLVCQPTDEAWRTYNSLVNNTRVTAALHLTC
ncbi:MAG: MTH938/NDUFAF3 family protein [Dehalococcoidia bacterium]|nr:MTH938/NDUFAF3 family protein [Dehalococcoidia bacterium]